MSTTDSLPTQETAQDSPPDLREFLKLRYMGDCKCGECHLVPAKAVKHYADLVDAQAKRIKTLETALTEINSQAVCVVIATEDECADMLVNCTRISEAALAGK